MRRDVQGLCCLGIVFNRSRTRQVSHNLSAPANAPQHDAPGGVFRLSQAAGLVMQPVMTAHPLFPRGPDVANHQRQVFIYRRSAVTHRDLCHRRRPHSPLWPLSNPGSDWLPGVIRQLRGLFCRCRHGVAAVWPPHQLPVRKPVSLAACTFIFTWALEGFFQAFGPAMAREQLRKVWC